MVTEPASPAPPEATSHRVRVVVAALIAAMLCAGGIAAGSLWTALALHANPQPRAAAVAAPTGTSESLAGLYQQVIAGVVTVSTEVNASPRRFAEATGSGIVVDKQGHILTNAHVVANARQVRVRFNDGQTVDAQVRSTDVGSDLAVAKRALTGLEGGKAVEHPWLGIRGEAITPARAQALGLSEHSGVLVVEVVAGSPAERAGLHGEGTATQADDILTAVDGHSIGSVEPLTAYLETRHVGDKVTLQVVRGGKRISLAATLGAFPDSTP